MRIRDPEIRPDYREFPLIENNRAVCTVVVGADAPEKVCAAAEDFAGLMEKITQSVTELFIISQICSKFLFRKL